MGRRLLRVAIALLIVAAIAVAGVATVARLAPEWVRAAGERALADALGAPVAIERVRLRVGPDLAFVGSGVRAWPDPAPAALEVERIEAQINPLPLLLGRVRLRRLALSGATLRLEYGADGRLRPAPFARFVPRVAAGAGDGSPAAGPPAPEQLLRWIDEVGRIAGRARVPGVAFELRRSRLVLVDRRAGGPEPGELRLDRLYASLGLRAFGRGATFVAGGRAGREGAPPGHFTLQADRGGDGSARVSLNAADLDLELPGWPLARDAAPAGRVTGSLILDADRDGRWRLDADVEVPRLRWTLRRPGRLAPRRIAVSRLGLRSSFEGDRQSLTLRDGSVELEDLRAAVGGRLSRPVQEGSVASLGVELGPIAVQRAWEDLRDLLPEAAALAPVMQAVQAGRIDRLEARARGTLARWPQLLVSGPARGGERLDVRSRVSGLRIRLEDGELLENLRGELVWNGDTLELQRAQGLRGGEPIPQLDIRLEGASHLLAAAGGEVPAEPGGRLPGLRTLLEIVRSRQDPSQPARPSQVTVEADWVRHPALLRPLEALRAVVAPTPEGVEFAVERARYGGVPVAGRGSYHGAPPARLVLEVAAADPASGARGAAAAPVEADDTGPLRAEAADRASAEPVEAGDTRPQLGAGRGGAPSGGPADAASASIWARGRFETDGFSLGPLSIESATGSFVAERSRLRLAGLDARLAPQARQRGEVVFDLARAVAVPVHIDFSVPPCPLPQLADALLIAPDDATGQVGAAGRFEGRLHPGRHPLDDLAGDLRVSARDGELRRKLPPFLAVARASDLPFSSLDRVRYDALDMTLRLEDGRLRVETFSLESPDLRALASGSVDVVDPEHEVEAVLGIFFFRGLDAALGRIPVVNELLLGADQNLVGAYFELTGPWTQPEAKLLATKALAEGPGNIVTGLPGFVKRGLDAIESMLQRGRAALPSGGAAAPKAGS